MVHAEMYLTVQGYGHIEPFARHLHLYMLNACTKRPTAGYDRAQGMVHGILAEHIDENIRQGAYVRGRTCISACDPAYNAFQPDRRRLCWFISFLSANPSPAWIQRIGPLPQRILPLTVTEYTTTANLQRAFFRTNEMPKSLAFPSCMGIIILTRTRLSARTILMLQQQVTGELLSSR